MTNRCHAVKEFLSLGEFALGGKGGIFNPYVALRAWTGTPGQYQVFRLSAQNENVRFVQSRNVRFHGWLGALWKRSESP